MTAAAEPPAFAPIDLARLRFDCFIQTARFSKPSPAASPAGDAQGVRPPGLGLSMKESLVLADELLSWCLLP